MPKWTFINGLTEEKIKGLDEMCTWTRALEIALESRATPDQSNYYVNVGAVTKSGSGVYGSNHEIGITETITHGEEAVIARALDEFGREDTIKVIAFVGLAPARIPSPCGNCRDAIKKYINLEKLVIVNGPREGGEAIIVPGKAYFFEEFKIASKKDFERISKSKALEQALIGKETAYDIYLNEKTSPPVYGAAIVCENGEIFRGSYRGDAAYHSVYPISSAIENFRNSSDNPDRLNVKRIVLATEINFEIPYKDRQHALEFAEAIQSLNGKSGKPLPVYIVRLNNQLIVQDILKTNTSEWLPLRFSPGHLGLESAMTEGYKKLRR
jgi:cytidine deaminase